MVNKRLTQITPTGAALILDNPKNDQEARIQLMKKYKLAIAKLAMYEDLEEQGEIIVSGKAKI